MTALKVHGTDLSHHNPDPDLVKAKKAGLEWMYHKATEGGSFADSRYISRRAAAKKAGLPFGAYHFARPDADGLDAEEEARHFVRTAKPRAGDLIPALDFEVSHPRAEAWAKRFQTEVTRLLGELQLETPVWMHYGPDDWGPDYHALRWVPRYNDDNRKPGVPWDIHQFSDGRYGTPNSFPGLGNVDLNHSKLPVSRLLISPMVKEPKQPFLDLYLMHLSMRYDKTRLEDVTKLLARAKAKKAAWITGTEVAGRSDLRHMLEKACKANGYRFHHEPGQDCWIAVRKKLITGKKWESHWEKVVDGVAGKYGDRGVMAITFDCEALGSEVTVAASHYLTKGRPDPKSPEYGKNFQENLAITRAIGRVARAKGAGKNLFFYGGDQNISDKIDDTFLGQPLTTSWDELGKYESTGHGPIDVIASYDRDVRVECRWTRALDDKEFQLDGDHYLVEAGYRVRLLKVAA